MGKKLYTSDIPKVKVDGKLGKYLINPNPYPTCPGLTVAFNEDGSVGLGIDKTPYGFVLSSQATDELVQLLSCRPKPLEDETNCFSLAG